MTDDYVAARITHEVDRLFEEDRNKHYGQLSTIPIVGGSYVPGQENGGVIRSLKKKARAALLAREWFAIHGPADAPPLPLSMGERDGLGIGSTTEAQYYLSVIVALYARSFESRKYNVLEHPSFEDYACGVMASEYNGREQMKENPQMRDRFPPRALAGLGPGLYWQPPEEHARTMENLRRWREREDRIRAVIAARDAGGNRYVVAR
jgi:hypothetical protein